MVLLVTISKLFDKGIILLLTSHPILAISFTHIKLMFFQAPFLFHTWSPFSFFSHKITYSGWLVSWKFKCTAHWSCFNLIWSWAVSYTSSTFMVSGKHWLHKRLMHKITDMFIDEEFLPQIHCPSWICMGRWHPSLALNGLLKFSHKFGSIFQPPLLIQENLPLLSMHSTVWFADRRFSYLRSSDYLCLIEPIYITSSFTFNIGIISENELK